MIDDPQGADIMRADEEAVEIALSGAEDDVEDVVRAVYMFAPLESLTSSKIAARVRRYAFDRHWSEESVWRKLRIARRAYAVARGLIPEK